ncbi:MAG: ribosome silencing factor [Gemmatimonadota bacterium]
MGGQTGLSPAESPESGESRQAAALELPAPLARAVQHAVDRKARDVVVMDLREVSNATDYFLIVSGTSDLHVKGVAEYVLEEMKREGVRANHVEGLRSARWVLIDYIDFVVHVFHPDARAFYQLENLWGDAPMERFTD